MSSHYCVRILQLKPAASSTDLEALIRVRVVEMERWIPGVLQFSLLRMNVPDGETMRYIMTLTFAGVEAYMYWRQVEDEAPTYWPQLASVLSSCEQLCTLIEEYEGTLIMRETLNSG